MTQQLAPIPIANYIIANNYAAAEQIVMRNGFNKPEAPSQTLNAINKLLAEKGEPILFALADAHPDYELIEKRVKEKNKLMCDLAKTEQKTETVIEKKSNATGEEKSNAVGDEKNIDNQRKEYFTKQMQIADETTSNLTGTSEDKKYLNLALLACVTVVAVVLIWKIA